MILDSDIFLPAFYLHLAEEKILVEIQAGTGKR